MADRFTLDACDWPLVINDGDVVVATLPLPNGSAGDDAAGLAQIERANAIVRFLNGDVADQNDDGERLECGGCGESFNTAESDANCVDTYCSAECENDDTDEGCPYNDPDCTSRADECHDACERQPPVSDGKGGVL